MSVRQIAALALLGAAACAVSFPDYAVAPREGEPCAAGTCAEGFVCAYTTVTKDGVCAKLCASDSDCTPPGGACAAFGDGTGSACTLNCNPITNAGCPSGTQCITASSTDKTRLITTCDLPGSKSVGEACDPSAIECATGLSCVSCDKVHGACAQVCDVSDASFCSCTQFAAPNTLGTLTLGFCGSCQ